MRSKNYDDFSNMLGRVSRILESFSWNTLEIIHQFTDPWYARVVDGLSDTLSNVNALAVTPSVVSGLVDRVYESMADFNSLDLPKAMIDALDMIPVVAASMSSLTEQMLQVPDRYIRLSQELVDRLNEAVARSRDLDSLEQPEEDGRPVQKVTPLVTFDRAVALLSLLLSLFSFLVTQLPNPQLEEQIEQNERLITIQEEQLELERQRTEQLQELVQDLGGIIVELHSEIQAQSQQIEALREQLQDAGDLPEPPAHSDEPSGLDQDADAQD